MRIADCNGMHFNIPRNAWFSFFNSPYPSHRLGTAVDVYFPDDVIFPLEEGRVIEVRKVRTPGYVPIRDDYLIIILVGEFCLKVLHVEPSVKPGELLTLGDPIGKMRVSGFFMPWSDPHAHFEMRKCDDSYRARGGLPMLPIIKKLVPVSAGNEFEVVDVSKEYAWAKPLKSSGKGMTPIGCEEGSVEGGLFHYGYGVLFGKSERICLFGTDIWITRRIGPNAGLFEGNFKVTVNGREVKGIGIYSNREMIKVIGRGFREGDILNITFTTCKP